MAEAINVKEKLVSVPKSVRPMPDTYHARTGLALPKEQSAIYQQQHEAKYADNNGMKLNRKKTKLMLFNTCKNCDFMPDFSVDGHQIEVEVEEEIKLLGLYIRSDLKWSTNRKQMVAKGYKRTLMLRRLKNLGVTGLELKDVFIKQIRSVLELAVSVWHSNFQL